MFTRLVLTVVAVLAVGLAAGGCGGSSSDSSDSTGAGESAQVEFTVLAESASASGNGRTLTLTRPSARMAWTADRPSRANGTIDVGDWVDAWDSFGFENDPPNADLTGTDSTGHRVDRVVVLTNPRRTNDALSFDVRSVDGREPAALDDVALFVDSSTGSYMTFSGQVGGQDAYGDVTPVANATLNLQLANGEGGDATTTSDSDGKYTISALCIGHQADDATLYVSARGYGEGEFDESPDCPSSTTNFNPLIDQS